MNKPAFPFKDGSGWTYSGMKLRDYFAAQAVTGLLSKDWGDPKTGQLPANVFELWAKAAYATADAMLVESQKTKD